MVKKLIQRPSGLIVPATVGEMKHLIPDHAFGINSQGMRFPIFVEHIQPVGLLPNLLISHALWYFLAFAHDHFTFLEGHVIYTNESITEEEMTRNAFMGIAQSTSGLYEVKLDDFFQMNLVNQAEREAERVGRVMNPVIKSWLSSGGNPKWSPEVGSKWKTQGTN